MSTLTTIGYEGAELEEFITTLSDADVECVIDVRELPLSRKRGFSKTALREALRDAGIGYVHLRALGDPKPGRDAARAGRFGEFMQIYREHLSTSEAQDALGQAGVTALTRNSCLLCYEREPENCHRKVVAESLALSYNVNVRHLFVQKNVSLSGRRKGRGVGIGAGQGGASTESTVW